MNNPPKHRSVYKAWLPVFALSFAVFVFNTTEFVPIGLLPNIAESFGRSEADAGMLIAIYAWIVSLMSLPLTIVTARIERRKLLIGLFVIFIVSHILSGFAWNFAVLMAARTGVAVAHAIFWSITAPLAVRLAPFNNRNRALVFIVVGSSLAAVLGVPIGTVVGQWTSWQVTFWLIGALALIITIVLAVLLPKLPSSNAGSLKSLPSLLKRPALLHIYLMTAIVITSYFTAYTYITPFMLQVGGFSERFIVFLLLLAGSAGMVGSFIFAKFSHNRKLLTIALGVLFLSLLAFHISASSRPTALALCFILGADFIVIMLSLQTKVLEVAHDASDVASSIYSAIFNIGIGGGAFIGGIVLTNIGMPSIGYFAAGFTFVAFVIFVLFSRRHFYQV
ncbi:MAG: sugar transporter [Campylobacteraceae bacterium]|jgi:DHA1 family L-arabinose/isopropyl-beta-D-thiogalactopyranoside export protein-like MFS transporter|nr:sugar transporter [Campylobacteraceae bacterium]